MELLVADGGFAKVERHVLGRPGDGVTASRVVPAGKWQAARSTGTYTLVGCTVAPGFAFDDFEMLRDVPAEEGALKARQPSMLHFL